jgi:translation elongation factor EF-1alpha
MDVSLRRPGDENRFDEPAEVTMDELLVGEVTHFFPAISVAAVELTEGGLQIGDSIRIVGHTSHFTQQVLSMQMDHTPVESAAKGDQVGIETVERARAGDIVFCTRPH